MALGRVASAAVCTTLPGFMMVAGIFSLGACPLTSIFSWAGSAESRLRACHHLTVCQGELSGSSLASTLTRLAVFAVENIFLTTAYILIGWFSHHLCPGITSSGGGVLPVS